MFTWQFISKGVKVFFFFFAMESYFVATGLETFWVSKCLWFVLQMLSCVWVVFYCCFFIVAIFTKSNMAAVLLWGCVNSVCYCFWLYKWFSKCLLLLLKCFSHARVLCGYFSITRYFVIVFGHCCLRLFCILFVCLLSSVCCVNSVCVFECCRREICTASAFIC